MNRYAQSIVKLAMIISLFTAFLADLISYVVIFTWIFHKFTRDFENFTLLLTNLTWLFVGLEIHCSNFYQTSSCICKNSIRSYNEFLFSNLFEIVLTFITQNLVSFTRNLSCPNWRFNQFKRCLSSSEFYYGPNRSHTFTRIFLTVKH